MGSPWRIASRAQMLGILFPSMRPFNARWNRRLQMLIYGYSSLAHTFSVCSVPMRLRATLMWRVSELAAASTPMQLLGAGGSRPERGWMHEGEGTNREHGHAKVWTLPAWGSFSERQ